MTKTELNVSKLIVKKSPIQGYGVFADQDIQAGDIIEESYTLISPNLDPNLSNYYFYKDENLRAIALGYGSIYNHSADPNANFECDLEEALITFRATRFIKQGEEIFISYGPTWFSSRDMKIKEPSWRYKLRRFKPLGFLLLRFVLVASGILLVMLLTAHN